MAEWSFLTNHARALLHIAHDSNTRLRDLAIVLDVTERTAHRIVEDLTEAGYLEKQREGRRNQYRIQTHQPLGESIRGDRTIGELLDLLLDANSAPTGTAPNGR